MKLFNMFTEQAPNKVFISILLGAVSGICYALLIPIVLTAITTDPNAITESESGIRTVLSFEVNNYKVATLFLLVCMFILFTRTISQIILTRVAIELATNIRIKLYKRIMATSSDVLESVGSSKLIATITTDVGRIVMGARQIPDLLANTVTIIGLLGFLIFLNIDVFWFVIGAIAFGIVTYQLPMMISEKYFKYSRQKHDDLQESTRGLIYGAKELKLNEVKKNAYFNEVLLENEFAVRKSQKTATTIVQTATNYGDLLSFFVIGIVTFIFVNYESMSNDKLVGVVMALLYITGPVAIVMNAIPNLLIARVSLNKVKKIFNELPLEPINQNITVLEPWQYIRFTEVCYQYTTQGIGKGFKVGPVDFTIHKSEITFIVGGNGSGKSTLSKLLTLHHSPTSGAIYFGNTLVANDNIKSCRQTLSSIYSDYYLFDRLLDGGHKEKKQEIDRYLKELNLDKKITIENGKFSTINLSDGQKRRLALLVAFLEDKEFYLFDEWAADQDPMFKEFFYYTVLPQLKNKGKAVVVISHDDRYFDIADKILVMENGMLMDCITDTETIKQRSANRTIVSEKGLVDYVTS